ncbi:ABC transporter permease subunit [Fervidobacterium sp.]
MLIFKWEFRRNLKSLFVWLVFIIGIQFMYSALFPSFAGEGGLFSSKMQLLPKVFLKIFGIEEIDFSNIIHFFAMQGQIWIFLFATFYVMRLASSIIVKEEDEKTVEFVLSRPLSRRQYILEKILPVIVNMIIYDFTIAFALLYMFNKYKVKSFDIRQFWYIVFAYVAVHIFMALIGITSSTVVRKRATADTITLFFLGFFYILSLIARVYENYAYLKKLTPFGVFDPADIIKTNSFNYKAFVFVILLYLAGAIFSVLYYEKKDIYA